MFEKFTEEAREAMNGAVAEALRFERDHIDNEHLFLGFLGAGVADRVPALQDITLRGAREQLQSITGYNIQETAETPLARRSKKMPFTRTSLNALKFADREHQQRRHDHIGSEHILLGLLQEPGDVASQLLADMSIDLDEARRDILARLQGNS